MEADSMNLEGVSISASSLSLADVNSAESACKFIAEIVAAPGVYNFDAFLSNAHIQAIGNDPQKATYLHLLRLFAFGVYADYNLEQFPALSEAALLKLRQLTLATLASKRNTVPYDVLQKELGLDSVRAVEEIFVGAKYAEVCNGRLNCREKTVEFSEWMTRGVEEMEIAEMTKLLSEWISKCETVHSDLMDQLNASEAEFREQKDREASVLAEIEKTKKKIEMGPVIRERSPSSNFKEQRREYLKRNRATTGRPFKRH
ncbi:hypothetical protein L596_008066 [Steinernema carpocapsae]|uniref:PCI domain-containing protein n=1 Tax=Steinernema carpocapsae TaxID=34508 RepID=A0A4U5PBE9_STECR|nr:hypothetical protein L596_008066 [Steinernema carpocapsae]